MPIPLREAPASFFNHGPVDGFNPPLLWCGWRISAQRAFDIVKERYKDKVFYTAEGPNEYFTVSGLAEYVCDEFNIAPEDRGCIHLVDVGDDDGKRALALTAGNNFPRTIPILEVYIDIQNALFNGEEPKWYLCFDQYHWTEADDCTKGEFNSVAQLSSLVSPTLICSRRH